MTSHHMKLSSEVMSNLTCIPEKFIVDFANSIDVNQDHIRVQSEKNSFFNRLIDNFTGKETRRQIEINTNIETALDSSLIWLTDLTEQLANSNYAIARVNDRVNDLTVQIAGLAQYSENTNFRLNELSQRLDVQMMHLNQEIARIDLKSNARDSIDQVFFKWAAGYFVNLSPACRCYAAMEELRWGMFGNFCIVNTGSELNSLLEQVINRATVQLCNDLNIDVGTRLSFYDEWHRLPPSTEQTSDWNQALSYLADNFTSDDAPLVVTMTKKLPERLDDVPILANASRIAEAIVHEVFLESKYV